MGEGGVAARVRGKGERRERKRVFTDIAIQQLGMIE